ncbi:MAG: hypothetical protein RJB66_121 [Pseudomonadota bacterium]|jgi:hypothetical protein
MRKFVSSWSLLAVLVFFEISCTKATQTQSSLGLSSASFSLRQDGEAPLLNGLIVNKTSKLATFHIVCETAHRELYLSLNEGTTFAKVSDIECVDGLAEILLPLNALPASIAPANVNAAVIPFQMKALANEFETEPLSGYFLQPTFDIGFLDLDGGSSTTADLVVKAEYSIALQAGSFLLKPKYVYFTFNSDCETGGQWYNYGLGEKSDLALPNANATNTVYAKFKDYAGNESGCSSASIRHQP